MTLRDYLTVLRRHKWMIALLTVVTAGAALVVSSLQTPVYQASTRLLLGSSQTTVDAGGYGQYIDPNRVATEIQVLTAKPIADIVAQKIGSAPGIAARAVGNTAVIELTASSNTAGQAAKVANAYADAYITYRQQQFKDTVSAQTKEYSSQIEDLSRQIGDILGRPRPAGSPEPPDVESLRAQQAAFRTKLQQVDSADKLSGSIAAVIAPAVPPTAAVSPTPRRNVILGLLVGLVLGVGIALLIDHLDDSIKSKDDLERVAPQLSILGVIPLVPGWRNRSDARVVAMSDPTSPAAEAYRTLRTSIQFIGLDRSVRVLQVTSPVASEGKSTTLANLAVTLSEAGMRVIVVCADLRRPRIHEFFGLSSDVGFTSVLLGRVALTGALQSIPGVPRLKVLAAGPLPPNPSELLSSRRTTDLLTQLGSQADVVLVDCPPVLPVTDAAVLASKVDGTVVVTSAGSTTYKDLSRTLELLNQVDAPVLGIVLNGGTSEPPYSYQYKAGYPTEARTNGHGRRGAKAEKDTPPVSTNGTRRKAG